MCEYLCSVLEAWYSKTLCHMYSNMLTFLMLSNIRRVIRILKFPLVRILKCCPSGGHKNASHCGLGLYHPANEGEGMIEDEMVGWHHWFNTHELEQAPGETEGRGSLVCCIHVVTKSRTQLRIWTTTMKERVEFYLCLFTAHTSVKHTAFAQVFFLGELPYFIYTHMPLTYSNNV